MLDGFSVGEVHSFHFVPKIAFADLSIKEGVKIPVNSQFVVHHSFLGAASILIKPSNKAEFIDPTDTIMGVSFKEPVLDSIKQKKLNMSINKIAEGFVELIQASSSDSIK